MKLKQYDNIEDFLKDTEEILLDNEAVNGLMLGIAEILKTDMNYYGSEPLLATVSSEAGIELVVMMTPPYKIQIINTGKNLDEASEALAIELLNKRWHIPAVIGEKETAKIFAKYWSRFKECDSKETMNLRIYELTKVAPIRIPKGKFRIAGMDDYDLVYKWTKAFMVDCFGNENHNAPDETAFLEDKIKSDSLYIWETDKPVSMAARTRPTPNSECVGSVYTPPNFRKKGYATAIVAELSREIMRKGKRFCTLFTDLSNPTSNSIYKKIGYKPVADVCDYVFEELS